MQVGVDVTYTYTNFGGHDLSSFGDIATFKNGQFPFRPMDYSPWSSKNLINWNRLKKFMQVGIDVTYTYTNFGGRDLSSFGDIATFQKRPIFPFDPWATNKYCTHKGERGEIKERRERRDEGEERIQYLQL